MEIAGSVHWHYSNWNECFINEP